MNLIKQIENKLNSRAFIGNGKADAKIQYNLPDSFLDEYDFVFYLNDKYQVAVIWDYRRRRKHQSSRPSSLCVNKQWKDVNLEETGIEDVYRCFKNDTNNESIVEKVLLVNYRLLPQIVEYLDLYIDLNSEDINYDPLLLSEKEIPEREYISTKRLSRDYRFRNKVLEKYDFRCAICRCSEEKILEAAHIVAVKNKGRDDVENGICLCANHHKMYDNGLIDIDIKSKTLKRVSESVKTMAWYKEFREKYYSKLL